MDDGLTTGWEADVPASDSLLWAYVLATAERAEMIAGAVGGRAQRTDAVSMVDTGSEILFDNFATFLRPLSANEAHAAVADIADFVPPELPFVVLSAWPIPGAGDLGVNLMGHPPFMYRPVAPPPDGWEAGLDVREVTDEAELAAFFRTIVEAYPIEGGASALADPGILDTDVKLFVGYEGDRPIGTAGVLVAHGQNDVEWISVYPDCRGKGYGAALTWAATLADPALPATLIASDPGQPVYERMGYLRLTRMSMWFRPPGGG
jgi:GNAT superfamily N-acetyltransferase